MRVLIAALTLLAACDAYRVLLVFPVPSRSHVNLGDGYVRHLLAAGHQVTYITPAPTKDPPKSLRQIDVSTNFALFPASDVLDLDKLMKKEIPSMDLEAVLQLMFVISNGTLFKDDVRRLILDPKEEFDVVIAEWMFSEVYSGLAPVFGCPLIWSSSMEPHALVLSLLGEDPNPAYVTAYSSSRTSPFNFQERVGGLWTLLSNKYYTWLSSQQQASLYERAFSSAAAVRGRQLPSYHEAKYNASLMLGNSHVSVGSAVSLPQSYVPIAGYHIEETVKPLPKDLQSIMDNAKHGVIYFSMGSVLSSKTMSAELKRGLLDMFGQLKQTVIWKLEESPEKLPKNVHLVGFAPQQSILNHPNCVLFITHGGLLSNTEALHFGVPIIGIPVFADQFLNVDRAVQKGYAKRVDLDHNIPNTLKLAVEDILGNSRYREVMKELSFVYHHRPVPPGAALAHWVEHAVRTRGAPHLRSPALMLPWYQKMYLDLLGLVLSHHTTTGLAHWVENAVRTRGVPHLRSPALMLPWYQKMYLDLLGLVLVGVLFSFAVVQRVLSKRIDVNKKNR